MCRGFSNFGGAPSKAAKMSASRLRSLCFLILLLASSWAWPLDPDKHISQYGHTAWRIQDGFFGGRGRSITQTTDGYIWVGTEAGLFRFDGVRFVSWSSQEGELLPSTFITALLGARDGSLWIGTDGGLAHWANQHLITYIKGGGTISSILQDVQGKIWLTRIRPGDNSRPFCQVTDTGVRCFGNQDGVPALVAAVLAQDASGNFWIGGDTTLLKWRPGSSKAYKPDALKSNAGVDGVEALSVAADDSLWIGMALTGRGLGLQHLVHERLKSFIVPKLNGETLEVTALVNDHQNSLWVGTANQGVYRIHGSDVDHYRTTEGLSGDFISEFFEDREGNLWMATSNGIDMFRGLRVTSFSRREGLSADNVDSVLASRDGTIWIGNANNLEVLSPDGGPSQAGKGLHGNQVTSLLEDHAGRLWAGIDNTLSVYQGGKFIQIRRQDGSPVGVVIGMTEDSENNIWAETMGPPGTLIRIRNTKVRGELPAPQMPLARKVIADPQSGIWLGLMNGDLARYRSGKTEIFRFTHHPDSRVNQLIAHPDGSILGASAFGAVGWNNGRQHILTVRNGLPCDSTHALISDNQGDLWLHAQCGLIQIPDSEVQRWWEQPESLLHVRVFDVSDGEQPGLGHFSSSAKSPDGRLWFANGSVLQMIDPAHVAGNTVVPPVSVNAIVADRKNYSAQEGLSLLPLTRDLEIDYTALSFVVPQKVLFRHMLEGHDGSWQEAGTRRQAFYNDLRPGHYRFHVIACNNDGVWNEAGAFLDFSILPAYYQTTWFRVACAGLFLSLLWALYQLRLQQLHRQFNIGLEARVNERTRIARELHDTLLQSFHGLLLRFQAASNLLPTRPDEAKKKLDNAIDQASQAMAEGRGAVQGLRSSTPVTNDLAVAIRTLGEELAAGEIHQKSPSFDVAVEGAPRELHPIVRDEVYRIAAEALRNGFRHAQANRIEVELRYDVHRFRLRIRDDGKGIDAQLLGAEGRKGHWGLHGMRERARLMGGNLELWSSVQSGTEVDLTIPASSAYDIQNSRYDIQNSRRSSWFSRKRA